MTISPERAALFLARGCEVGKVPYAPGTFGTLLAVPLYLLLAPLPVPVYLLAVLALFLAGIPLCGIASRALGGDHPSIVWDELVGYLATMTAAPAGWPWVLAGFALFRAFDIAKPWPIRAVDERVQGGLGIMLDDLLAAAYAWAALALGAHL